MEHYFVVYLDRIITMFKTPYTAECALKIKSTFAVYMCQTHIYAALTCATLNRVQLKQVL